MANASHGALFLCWQHSCSTFWKWNSKSAHVWYHDIILHPSKWISKERQIKTRKCNACNTDKELIICWYLVLLKVKMLFLILISKMLTETFLEGNLALSIKMKNAYHLWFGNPEGILAHVQNDAHTVVMFVIARKQEPLKCSPAGRWLNTILYREAVYKLEGRMWSPALTLTARVIGTSC